MRGRSAIGGAPPTSTPRLARGLRVQELEGTMVSADISGFTTLAERLAERGREGAEELRSVSGCFEG